MCRTETYRRVWQATRDNGKKEIKPERDENKRAESDKRVTKRGVVLEIALQFDFSPMDTGVSTLECFQNSIVVCLAGVIHDVTLHQIYLLNSQYISLKRRQKRDLNDFCVFHNL